MGHPLTDIVLWRSPGYPELRQEQEEEMGGQANRAVSVNPGLSSAEVGEQEALAILTGRFWQR